MADLFMYVIDRDFGFAPNPFHGVCTLATCKPQIRSVAKVGDWILGMGGGRLRATGHCIFSMKVGRKLTFNQYWADPEYRDKRPVRNGSRRLLVGDNIYHQIGGAGEWMQEDSHHSYEDGTPNPHNIKNDTQTDAVLISDHFFYFGRDAARIPQELLDDLGYKNPRSHRRFPSGDSSIALVDWIVTSFKNQANLVLSDPFDFEYTSARYSVKTNKVSR